MYVNQQSNSTKNYFHLYRIFKPANPARVYKYATELWNYDIDIICTLYEQRIKIDIYFIFFGFKQY